MIRYTLKCEAAHRFEAWFGSAADYDRLQAAGHVACAVCGSNAVEKDLMTPSIGSGDAARGSEDPDRPAAPDLARPASPVEQAIAELRRRVEAHAENVGRNFAREARRIHAGEAPNRPIWGEARLAEARALVEEGIPVAPLPWSSRRTN